jgi:hypothetical protein
MAGQDPHLKHGVEERFRVGAADRKTAVWESAAVTDAICSSNGLAEALTAGSR